MKILLNLILFIFLIVLSACNSSKRKEALQQPDVVKAANNHLEDEAYRLKIESSASETKKTIAEPGTTTLEPEKNKEKIKTNPPENTYALNEEQIKNGNGIGPIKEVKLGQIDPKLVKAGDKIFNTQCIACHSLNEKKIGPALKNVTTRLSPVYIMNYLLNSDEMQKKDEYMKKRLKEFLVPMPNQNLTQEQARSILEFFRANDR